MKYFLIVTFIGGAAIALILWAQYCEDQWHHATVEHFENHCTHVGTRISDSWVYRRVAQYRCDGSLFEYTLPTTVLFDKAKGD